MDSRTQILSRLGTKQSTTIPGDTPTDLDAEAIRRHFITRAEAARCTVESVASLESAPAAISTYLRGRNLEGPVRLAPELAGRVSVSNAQVGLPVLDQISDGLVVVATCPAAVAETGSVVVTSGEGADARLNYVAETLIMLLPAAGIVSRHEEVWPLLRARMGARLPRLVSFVTGPSRTADIEQTIEFGAHGARHVHILIVEEGL
ncbi:MAG: lactate utilization protein C [Alphaproteobacteria bacterium]